MSLFQRFRRNGIRQAKSLVASTADIVSDWIFYLNILEDDVLNDKYGFYLLIMACVSSGLGAIILLSYIYGCIANSKKNPNNLKYSPFSRCLKLVLALEMLLADIPQFVMSAFVIQEQGEMTPYVVFTMATSGINFLLDLLDMIEIEEDSDDAVEQQEEDSVEYDREVKARVY